VIGDLGFWEWESQILGIGIGDPWNLEISGIPGILESLESEIVKSWNLEFSGILNSLES
jgi:hypothetical protein